ncbi:MAG: hypothetical protein Q4G46_03435 [Propionibacteriaceae bacterium]|nr:hypothetical protein [Propionibacteriaceae bacterium]
MTQLDPDDLVAELRDADPARHLEAASDDYRALLRASLPARSSRASSRPQTSRRTTRLLVVGATVLAVAIPGAAAASVFAARTGWFGNAEHTETDATEFLDMTAPDYPEAAAREWPAYITLPPAYHRSEFALAVSRHRAAQARVGDARDPAGGKGVVEQVTVARFGFDEYARCAWRAEWLSANESGDEVRERRAADALTTAASWPSTVAVDGGGIVAGHQDLAGAARSGDRAGVESRNIQCGAMLEVVRR